MQSQQIPDRPPVPDRGYHPIQNFKNFVFGGVKHPAGNLSARSVQNHDHHDELVGYTIRGFRSSPFLTIRPGPGTVVWPKLHWELPDWRPWAGPSPGWLSNDLVSYIIRGPRADHLKVQAWPKPCHHGLASTSLGNWPDGGRGQGPALFIFWSFWIQKFFRNMNQRIINPVEKCRWIDFSIDLYRVVVQNKKI